MSACRFCGLALPEGFGLGVCPHGDAHTACCMEMVELRLAVSNGVAAVRADSGYRACLGQAEEFTRRV